MSLGSAKRSVDMASLIPDHQLEQVPLIAGKHILHPADISIQLAAGLIRFEGDPGELQE